jgi:hypothetical protein
LLTKALGVPALFCLNGEDKGFLVRIKIRQRKAMPL